MTRVQGISVELAGSYDTQHLRRTPSQTHLLAHAEVLVDLCKAASGQDLDWVEVAVLGLPDSLRGDAHGTQLVLKFLVLSKKHN